jgi:ADP-ribose pyrophosphatase
VAHESVFRGRLLDVYVDRIESRNGTQKTREVVEHPGAAAIVPILPGGDILLVRQYRHAVTADLWEIPAGKIDPGEDPLSCARRELREETGYVAERWTELAAFFTTPGFSNERITLFRASDLRRVEDPTPGEIDASRPFARTALAGMIASGALDDGKTLVGLLLCGVVPSDSV